MNATTYNILSRIFDSLAVAWLADDVPAAKRGEVQVNSNLAFDAACAFHGTSRQVWEAEMNRRADRAHRKLANGDRAAAKAGFKGLWS
jgi:hypothetical protein